MKSNLQIISVVVVSLLLALTFSCKKEAPKVIPSISTSAPTNITLSTATCGGAISADGGAPVTSRGVCWSVIQNPTTSDTKTSDGSGIGNFTSSISGLAPGTAYYMRAYATNSVGTAYGNQVVSTTISTLSTITTIAVVNITTTTATSGGTVSADGGAPVFSRGVCWSTSQNPTILNDRTNNGTGTGTFTSTIIGLNPGTTYYLRAYATNSPGTAYGTQISFTTGVVPVSAFTATPTTITAGQSVLFTDESTNTPTSWSWNFGDGGTSTSQNPSHSYATAGTYTVALTATNSFGSNTQTKTNYITVNTAGSSPVAAFTATPTSITAGQNVQFTDQSTNTPTSWSWTFGDGGTSTTKNPSHTYASAGTYTVSLTSTNSFGSNTQTKTNYITVNIAGSSPVSAFTATPTTITAGQSIQFTDQSTNTPTSWSWNFGDGGTSTTKNPSHTYASAGTYTVVLTATNSFGSNTQTKTNYITVNIAGSSPVSAFTATPTTITAGQNVQFTDQSANTPTSWSWNFGDGGTSTTRNPSHTYATAGTYSVGLRATNSFGSNTQAKTNYINVNANAVSGGIIFNPDLTYGSVTDIDGNVYKTILIGSQTWMAENLKTTKYSNGNSIGTTTPATLEIWNSIAYPTPKYQWAYAGNESNVATYGRLYTWYAATDSRNVCPTGWHLPTDEEWTTLTTFLGGESVAGGKLKETGTSHWISPNGGAPNTGATNSSGFTALPGGGRGSNGTFSMIGDYGYWWSSTFEAGSNRTWHRAIGSGTGDVYNLSEGIKTSGDSVRCLRD